MSDRCVESVENVIAVDIARAWAFADEIAIQLLVIEVSLGEDIPSILVFLHNPGAHSG